MSDVQYSSPQVHILTPLYHRLSWIAVAARSAGPGLFSSSVCFRHQCGARGGSVENVPGQAGGDTRDCPLSCPFSFTSLRVTL
eukprot:5518584-Pyramimonas_sp.AAC.1